MMNLLLSFIVLQGDDFNKLLNYFFDFGNPVFYSLILTFLVFYILAFFYSGHIIPHEEAIFRERSGIYKTVETELTSIMKLNPDPLLKIEKNGLVSAFNSSASTIFPPLNNGTCDIINILPECETTLTDVIGKDVIRSFSFVREDKYYSAHITSLQNLEYAMIHIHDSNSYFPLQKEYDKMVEAIDKTRIFIFDRIEAEQNRIARALHDSVGQIFTAAKLRITQLEKTDDPQLLNEIINESIELLSHGIDELKEVSYRLRPKMLEELGLTAAIEAMLKRVVQNRYINYDFSYTGDFGNLPPRLEVAVYRIVQEIVSNIMKHSKASKINIMLKNNKNIVRLLVVDNGIGFNFREMIKRSGKNRSMGLVNIVDRVELFEGSYDFKNDPDEGTVITIEIPLNSNIDEQTDYFGTTRG